MNLLSEQDVQAEIEAQMLTPSVVRAARERAATERRSVPAVLEDDLGLPAERLVRAIGQAMGLRVWASAELAALHPAFELVGYAEAVRRGCLSLRDGEHRHAVIADPFDDALQAWCAERLAGTHELGLASMADISAYLVRHEDSMRAIDTALPGTATGPGGDTGGDAEGLTIRSIGEGTSVVVKLVDSTLYDALKSPGVSDIHLESHLARAWSVKYRLDGVLQAGGHGPTAASFAEPCRSRGIKVLADLDISERRVPQDGRLKLSRQRPRRSTCACPSCRTCTAKTRCVRVLDRYQISGRSGIGAAASNVLGFDAANARFVPPA